MTTEQKCIIVAEAEGYKIRLYHNCDWLDCFVETVEKQKG